ncbi:hypothetical protein [Streptomyces hilarionis]|uniref:hypothetical protein n=1 Tax=Streptomyces hilarionis TaxID=2839954 RepID=UPI00211A9F5B|nr:hypothetical protein [Streptomyces hilarionis]MCQ9132693.1 hypothetical protein [Streptomyces hilarionis]
MAGTALLLLLAGHETTSGMLAPSTLALLSHPGGPARLGGDPAHVKGAVEELLRHLTIVHNGVGRVALEDGEIGGQTIGPERACCACSPPPTGTRRSLRTALETLPRRPRSPGERGRHGPSGGAPPGGAPPLGISGREPRTRQPSRGP